MKKLIEALGILSKYYDFDKEGYACGHDQIWLCDYTEGLLSPEDEKRMLELNFFNDEDAWSTYT